MHKADWTLNSKNSLSVSCTVLTFILALIKIHFVSWLTSQIAPWQWWLLVWLCSAVVHFLLEDNDPCIMTPQEYVRSYEQPFDVTLDSGQCSSLPEKSLYLHLLYFLSVAGGVCNCLTTHLLPHACHLSSLGMCFCVSTSHGSHFVHGWGWEHVCVCVNDWINGVFFI